MKTAIFAFITLLMQSIECQEFNEFKSYGNAQVKPKQYARRQVKHDISEYLDERQKKMMVIRNSPDTPNVMFDNNWSYI
jgi:hypothetical protein